MNQHLFNALHDLGVVALEDDMNMVLEAVVKDAQEYCEWRREAEKDTEPQDPAMKLLNSLNWLKEKASGFLTDSIINEDELESIEAAIDNVLRARKLPTTGIEDYD